MTHLNSLSKPSVEYFGTSTLDESGTSTIDLPGYFEAKGAVHA
ncbi:hypothetical protein [Arthrobacter sp. 92]